MILKYVMTTERMSQEDLLSYAKELVSRFDRGGLERVEVLAIPITPETTNREIVKAITNQPLVNALPPGERVEFSVSFRELFKGKNPGDKVLTGKGDPSEELHAIFMMLTTEKPQ